MTNVFYYDVTVNLLAMVLSLAVTAYHIVISHFLILNIIQTHAFINKLVTTIIMTTSNKLPFMSANYKYIPLANQTQVLLNH